MEELYFSTLIIMLLGVAAAIVAHIFKISIALIEIIIGIMAGYLMQRWIPSYHITLDSAWFVMLASVGALMLTFLAGIELDAGTIKREWRSAGLIGVASFLAPFIGCGLVVHYGLGWEFRASILAGLVLSTTSVAVVYGTLLECGLIETWYGKSLLATCFITDMCTVLALGFIFTPVSLKTFIFFVVLAAVCLVLIPLTRSSFKVFGNKPTAFELKFILLFLVALGLLAMWAEYEPVLPAFFAGIALSSVIGRNKTLINHIQTITFGLLTPFYFIRAGFLVSVPVLLSSMMPILLLLLMKIACKGAGIYTSAGLMKSYPKERPYTILLMSTGLAFGSIAALFGLTHHMIDRSQYTLLIAVVVLSAVIPTIVANLFFFPHNFSAKPAHHG